MTPDQRFTLTLFIISVICLPTLAFVIRATVKWTRVEDKLDGIADDMARLVKDKDQVHQEIAAQMHEDRQATNERLTWLERNAWGRNSGPAGH